MSKAIPTKKLTAYFYEAEFISDSVGTTLEGAVRSAVGKLQKVGDRQELGKDLFCKQTLNDVSDFGAAGYGICIIEYEPNGLAQVVQDFAQHDLVKCNEFQLDGGQNFVARDNMVFISGNRLTVCGCNGGKDMFKYYLNRLIKRANVINGNSDFIVRPVSDLDVHTRVAAKGIRSVAVTAKHGLAEINTALDAEGIKPNALIEFLRAFASESKTTPDNAKIWLKLEKGRKEAPEFDAAMTKYALELMNNEHGDIDDFVIFIKGESMPIKGSMLHKTAVIEIPRLGHSVKTDDAWIQLHGLL